MTKFCQSRENSCPRCGGHTYTYGQPLAGQHKPPEGDVDTRIRHRTHCNSCGTDWDTQKGPTTGDAPSKPPPAPRWSRP